ncbi:hypothetical protein HID58_045549 [Brassica napus]|uniref:Uncharacterized protein n=1 Tax=Brassica napus TaxID=3708 RepID=A0ABQ8ATW7_BRANA|nr:hypothetical protein HID58_045549 [Brassica napus]
MRGQIHELFDYDKTHYFTIAKLHTLLPPSFTTDLLPFWFAFKDRRRFGVPLAPPLLARAPTGFFALTGLAGLGLVLKAVSCSTSDELYPQPPFLIFPFLTKQ